MVATFNVGFYEEMVLDSEKKADCSNGDDRKMYLELARTWRFMAEAYGLLDSPDVKNERFLREKRSQGLHTALDRVLNCGPIAKI